MALDPRKLTIIRAAIDDSGSTTYTDDNIEDVYESLNQNVQSTIAHYLLVKAVSEDWPTAPTAPTLDEYPDTSMELWQRHNQDHLNLFAQQLSLFREQQSLARAKMDVYRAHAQLYIEAGRNGEIL